jgi:hypothetical protein
MTYYIVGAIIFAISIAAYFFRYSLGSSISSGWKSGELFKIEQKIKAITKKRQKLLASQQKLTKRHEELRFKGGSDVKSR